MIHVVSTSGGKGSWFTGRVVAERMNPGDHLVLLFADTMMEDEDLYRFLDETVADTLAQIPNGTTGEFIRLADGRDVWEVFFDKRFLGNSRIDPCSQILKRQLIRHHIDTHYDPRDTTVYLGIDWTEAHRFTKAEPYWHPYAVRAPLTEEPFIERADIDAALAAAGIEDARLYKLGMKHNNCGGFCVKAGMASFRHLLEVMPERYAYHEAKELELRAYLDKDVTILMDRSRAGILEALGLTEDDVYTHTTPVDGKRPRKETRIRATDEPLPMKVPITLRAFRERLQSAASLEEAARGDAVALEDMQYEFGGCACFTPDDYEKDAVPDAPRPPVQLAFPTFRARE